ncbi:acyltransferase [Flammeovirgaceae bacterium SG7u.111]|nr:acyltransferase [Flammeovirgaceae bacterium SG7u.132]WPO34567.1 acyltransferase [Flammeovirgaceae bacterium SG7u.111]
MKKIITYIKTNPNAKYWVLKMLFRPKPYSSRLRFWAKCIFIFPKYLQKGIPLKCRLDLAPFHKLVIGKKCRIEKDVVINNGMGDVVLGEEVHTGIGCIISGPVTFHKHVGLAQYVRVIGLHHGIRADSPHHYQEVTKAPVILEEDAFVGTGAVIMGKKNGEPLTLGKYCRIGANAVVTTDIPAYSIAVGNPAKVIKKWDFEKEKYVKV